MSPSQKRRLWARLAAFPSAALALWLGYEIVHVLARDGAAIGLFEVRTGTALLVAFALAWATWRERRWAAWCAFSIGASWPWERPSRDGGHGVHAGLRGVGLRLRGVSLGVTEKHLIAYDQTRPERNASRASRKVTYEVLVSDDAQLSVGERVVLVVGRTPASDLVVALDLLREDLADAIVLAPVRREWALSVRVHETPTRATGVELLRSRDDRWEIRLNRTHVDMLAVFLLKSCRDGNAAVDYVDLPRIYEGRTVDFTLKVSGVRPPVSEDEARRRLGLKSGRR